MKRISCLVVLAVLLLAAAPAAPAAETTMLMKFTNQTKAPVKVTMLGEGYSASQTAAPGKSVTFSTTDKAWLDRHHAYAYTFMARSEEPGNINCRWQVALGNIWTTDPMVVSCDANINFGDCKVTKHKRSMAKCIVGISTSD
ncbi:MAG: hypothetical protein KQH53_19075 [Desulfarculaceae bacterium]|nr:hypothetical protein [Desulfarculaceae bacterium]